MIYAGIYSKCQRQASIGTTSALFVKQLGYLVGSAGVSKILHSDDLEYATLAVV